MEAGRIAARASYIIGLAFHDEFRPERWRTEESCLLMTKAYF